MMYPFMTLDDDTEVVHSEMLADGRVKVYFEKPSKKDCFHSAVCYLPGYEWQDIHGFSQDDIQKYQSFLESVAHLILPFSKEGGCLRFLKSALIGSTFGQMKTIP